MQPSGSVPLLEAEANETFGPGNPGRGPFIRLPARKRPGMSQAALAKSRRSAIYGILVVAALTAGASGTFAADGCPTSASEISTDRPDVTNSSRVVPYGSLQAENGVDWSVRQGSNVVSGSETRLRLGVAQCPEVLADVPTYFTPSTAGRRPDFPTSLSPSRGNWLSLICNQRFGISDWRQRNFKPRLRSLHPVPLVATNQRRVVVPRYGHCVRRLLGMW
jgi:hypothetical protein